MMRQFVYAAGTAVHMAVEDPWLLVIQATRRLPRAMRAHLAEFVDSHSADWRHAVALWLADQDTAREEVAALIRMGAPGPRRLLAEVGVLLALPEASDHGSPKTRARSAMRFGALTEAIRRAHGTPLRDRYLAERTVMTPGNSLVGYRQSQPRRQQKLAVLHILTNSPPHTLSGYTQRSHQVLLAQQAAGIQTAATTRIGYPVTIGRPFARRRDTLDGIDYSRLIPWLPARTTTRRLQQQLALLRPHADRLGASVLHTTTHYPNALVTRALAEERGIPWVYEVRGALEDTWVASFPPEHREAARTSERYRLSRERETEMMQAANAVVTLTHTMRADLITRGIPAARISVLPNGVAAQLLNIRQDPAAARRQVGLPSPGFWVGTISSLVGYEGIDTLLHAIRIARDAGADIHAGIVGDGVARPSLARLRRELRLDEIVHMPGRVHPDEVLPWYLAFDAFAVTRSETEVTRKVAPLKHIQAMALGRPLVVSDLPALTESSAGGALIAPAGDPSAVAEALINLAENPELRATLGTRGR
ncbi:MAG: glycosyltransferase, partial [Propioniciclava sp.]